MMIIITSVFFVLTIVMYIVAAVSYVRCRRYRSNIAMQLRDMQHGLIRAYPYRRQATVATTLGIITILCQFLT